MKKTIILIMIVFLIGCTSRKKIDTLNKNGQSSEIMNEEVKKQEITRSQIRNTDPIFTINEAAQFCGYNMSLCKQNKKTKRYDIQGYSVYWLNFSESEVNELYIKNGYSYDEYSKLVYLNDVQVGWFVVEGEKAYHDGALPLELVRKDQEIEVVDINAGGNKIEEVSAVEIVGVKDSIKDIIGTKVEKEDILELIKKR